MKIITDDFTYNHTIESSKIHKIIEGDIIVPDSKPDIIKLLQTDANVLVQEKEISEGCIKINGRVDLSLIYTPETESESIKGFFYSMDFDELITNKAIESLDNVFITANVEKLDCFMINSRKVHIKATVCMEYEILRIQPISFATDLNECTNPQIIRDKISFQNSINICEHQFTILEKLELPSGQESIAELLKSNIKICDTEYKALNDKIVIKGTMGVSILYTSVSGKIECNETELQFTEIMNCENITEDCFCDIDFSICNYKLQLDEDTDGDMRILNIQVDVNASVRSVEDLEIDVICDCYEPGKQTTLQSNRFTLEEIVLRPSLQTTIRELVTPDDNMPSISHVYDIIATPHITSAKISGGKLLCEGHIKTFILYISESQDIPVHSIYKEIPISNMIDCQIFDDSLYPQLKAEIKHTSYNLNAAGEIEIRIVLSLKANIINKREIELISDVIQSNPSNDSSSKITIYFVQNNDTLWNIAKQYQVPISGIIKMNSLKDEHIKPGTRLMIPGI